MSPKIHAHAVAILAVNLVVTVAVLRPAFAADASAWDGDQRAAVRLIAGAQRGAVHRAGIEIRLAPGWKTYWRYPGDSGIPPRFDFSELEECEVRDGALSGAASAHRRERHVDRL